MKNVSITNGFTQMSDSKLETRAYQILTAMTDNVNFTDDWTYSPGTFSRTQASHPAQAQWAHPR